MKNFINQLTALTLGLVYISESDFPWEISSEGFTNIDAEEINADSFFKNLIYEQDTRDEFVKAQSLRYQMLYDFLCEQCCFISVYKTGKIKRQLIIELETMEHEKVFLKTYSIET
jgi:hypothetical protein